MTACFILWENIMLVNLKDILKVAADHDFSIGAFNITEAMNFRCVFETAEELKAPVIIAVSTQEMELVRSQFYQYIRPLLMNSRNVYCLHLDHGREMKDVLRAIQAGFTSVMIDKSHLPFMENVEETKKIVDLAHLVDISVEGELGTIGVNHYDTGIVDSISYTDPEDAIRYIELTGVDALAVSIGTAHGLYPENYVPKIDLELLKRIKEVTSVPLVLHGGSGNPDEEIRMACKLGIKKINISSEYKLAFAEKLKEVLNDTDEFTFSRIMPRVIPLAKEVIRKKIELFNSTNKQHLYYDL